jgi:hypothetical protein
VYKDGGKKKVYTLVVRDCALYLCGTRGGTAGMHAVRAICVIAIRRTGCRGWAQELENVWLHIIRALTPMLIRRLEYSACAS